jgi:hypothetical protein
MYAKCFSSSAILYMKLPLHEESHSVPLLSGLVFEPGPPEYQVGGQPLQINEVLKETVFT